MYFFDVDNLSGQAARVIAAWFTARAEQETDRAVAFALTQLANLAQRGLYECVVEDIAALPEPHRDAVPSTFFAVFSARDTYVYSGEENSQAIETYQTALRAVISD